MRWLLFFIALSAHAEEWKATDYLMLGAATTLLVADWGQTRDMVSGDTCQRWVANPTSQGIGARQESYSCRTRKESNPVLGEYPSREEVDQYFALAILGTAGLAYVLPQDWRRFFLGGVIVLQTFYVYRNHQVGLRINF